MPLVLIAIALLAAGHAVMGAETIGAWEAAGDGVRVLPDPRSNLPNGDPELLRPKGHVASPVPAGELRRLPPVMTPELTSTETVTPSASETLSDTTVTAEDGFRVPFESRVEQFVTAAGDMRAPFDVPPLPQGFVPWWQTEVVAPQRRGTRPFPLQLDSLLVQALVYSPHVQAVRDTAQSRATAIVEAESEFDLRTFMESKFVRTSDPVGNILETGGPPRFRDQTWNYDGGVRKKTTYGGSMEIAQRFGFKDNNSEFLDPKQQGQARLSLRFDQPLLNGAGRAYNRSRILLAQLDTHVAQDELADQLMRHLMEVNRAYWDLYLRRAALQQKKRHVERAERILRRLIDRQQVDALQSQVLTARAAVHMRRADLNRAAAAIRNAEARLRLLVSAPDLYQEVPLELIPGTAPTTLEVQVALGDALVTALHNRPEFDKAIHEARMAAVRLDLSSNELLPVLNLVLETYVAGLQGESRMDNAWVDQFSVGEPGYTAGLLFEVPLYNRAAVARFERRNIEMRRVTAELRSTADQLMTEVEIAVRAIHTTYRDMLGWYRSMAAARADMDYLHDRWELLPGDDRSASFLLEDLLKAQDRLAASEYGFVDAQRAYALALVELKRATGTLLEYDRLPPPGPAR